MREGGHNKTDNYFNFFPHHSLRAVWSRFLEKRKLVFTRSAAYDPLYIYIYIYPLTQLCKICLIFLHRYFKTRQSIVIFALLGFCTWKRVRFTSSQPEKVKSLQIFMGKWAFGTSVFINQDHLSASSLALHEILRPVGALPREQRNGKH